MSAREILTRERQLTDREADEILQRASVLQEKARAERRRSVDELKEIGSEIDVEREWIDAALAEIEGEKVEANVQRAAGQKRLKQTLGAIGSAMFLTLGLGWAGSTSVNEAKANADAARIAFDTVIDRQGALVPQLIAMSGGSSEAIVALRDMLAKATTTSERTAAAEALQLELAKSLGQLPPTTDDATAQQRLSLQHEVVGAQNRISVEQRRFAEALAQWKRASETPFGKLGVALGLADAPGSRDH